MEECEALQQRVLAMREAALGLDHEDTYGILYYSLYDTIIRLDLLDLLDFYTIIRYWCTAVLFLLCAKPPSA